MQQEEKNFSRPLDWPVLHEKVRIHERYYIQTLEYPEAPWRGYIKVFFETESIGTALSRDGAKARVLSHMIQRLEKGDINYV
jgi:hypothetical protein